LRALEQDNRPSAMRDLGLLKLEQMLAQRGKRRVLVAIIG
jgi:hypothetical protein